MAVVGIVSAASALPMVRPVRHRARTVRRGTVLIVAVTAAAFGSAPVSAAIVPTVPLGTAANYSVLGSESVNNTGPSVLNNSVGVSPGTSVTGFPPGVVTPPAIIDATTPTAAQAKLDLTAAYLDAAGRPLNATTAAELAGLTLVGGVYAGPSKSALSLTGTLTLDGAGDPNSVFIFQTDSTLTVASGSQVLFINGAQECNVFWQVGSSATVGTGAAFAGNILALTSVSVTTGATVRGRALAQTGSVTLDNNVFTAPTCDMVPPTTTTTTTTTTTVPTPITPDTPSSTLPVTGPQVQTALWWAIAAVGLGASAVVGARRRKTS
ncbi:MAG TPA: ice-binding family protein [Ilumatobacteraceae bacterium]|nr:ice-binding family protein [Ilumatobacteraceae bacterium]